jgi:hypothetical protein
MKIGAAAGDGEAGKISTKSVRMRNAYLQKRVAEELTGKANVENQVIRPTTSW